MIDHEEEDGKNIPTWHLSRRVTLSVIVALAMMAGSLLSFAGTTIWWARGVDSDMESVRQHIAETKGQPTQIARLQEQYISIKESLVEIKSLLRSHASNDDTTRSVATPATKSYR
jgi:Tfp pilus assembly protein PilO